MAEKKPEDSPKPTEDQVSESNDPSSHKQEGAKEGPEGIQQSTPTNHDRSRSVRLSTGNWRGKASAIAEIARESISKDSHSANSSPKTPKQRLTQTLRRPSKSSPSAASMTKVHVTSSHSDEAPHSSELKPPAELQAAQETSKEGADIDEMKAATDGTSDEATKEASDFNIAKASPIINTASSWRGWLSRARNESLDQPKTAATEDKIAEETKKAEILQPKQSEIPSNTKVMGDQIAQKPVEAQQDSDSTINEPQPEAVSAKTQSRSSWFGLWGLQPQPGAQDPGVQGAPKADTVVPSESSVSATPETSRSEAPGALQSQQQRIAERPASSSWAFWSREKPQSKYQDEKKDLEVGEMAVANTSTQSNPERAEISSTSQMPAPAPSQDPKSKKRERPRSAETLASASSKRTAHEKQETRQEAVEAPHMRESSLKATTEQLTKQRIKQSPPNLILPSFDNTYQLSNQPSYWQQISRVIVGNNSHKNRHLSKSSTPHRIRKALVIGVHGYFPAPLLQKVLGTPTGTSIRFADGAAEAIGKYTASQGYSCEIEKVALEGEGMIADRIDTLWRLLLNWIDQIRKADFILVACHSQGVPVAINLVAKLLNFGCISSSARLGVCSMAGASLGPFATYQSRFIGGSAGELFEFAKPGSSVSKSYESALALALKHHVRILYVGSIDDQLISMESSVFSNVSHPYIYRAVFVDGRIHAPDFLSHLVGFALKLRNLGISDHGLIRELSGPLAGSLYTGEGHSRIYEDQAVYELAVRHAAETTSLLGTMAADPAANPEPEVKPYQAPNSNTTNPYFLPWAVRGVLEEEYVKTELQGEMEELLSTFDKWKPQSKVLKDVKFRLEAVRSKL